MQAKNLDCNPKCHSHDMRFWTRDLASSLSILERQRRIITPACLTGLLRRSNEISSGCTRYREAWHIGGGQ